MTRPQYEPVPPGSTTREGVKAGGPCRCARCESGDRVHPRAARDPFAWLRHLPEAEQLDALKASVSDPENIFQVPIVPTTFHAADEPGCVATMALWARCEAALAGLVDSDGPDGWDAAEHLAARKAAERALGRRK